MVRGGSMRRSSPPPGGRAGGVASSCGRRPGALGLDHGRRHHLLRLRLGHHCSRLQSLAIRARTPLLPPPVLTGDSRRPHLLQHWLSLFPVPILASWFAWCVDRAKGQDASIRRGQSQMTKVCSSVAKFGTIPWGGPGTSCSDPARIPTIYC
ncbi:uncharacterized protein [Triticum aestivum]|uniref:uncharacterized protein n=1 Tax=Triticum aestivum TaxID=4565 RepID=UPI001D011B6C|nr:uncharacterized protein LOC123114887 [Triticum aestivum]